MRRTTYFSNRTNPLLRAVRFPFTLSNRGGAMLPPNSSYTIETWFKLNAWTNAPSVFGGTHSETHQKLFLGSSFQFHITNNGTDMGVLGFESFNGGSIETLAIVPVQQWVHLCLTYDATNLQGTIHLNNALVGQGSFSAPQQQFTGLDLGHIGSNRSVSNMNGQMDETRIWPYVRSAEQNAASWQRPNYLLPDLPQAAAAWGYEDPIPSNPGSWTGFTDASGHGQFLMSSTNQYEGSQPVSTVPFQAPAAWNPTRLGSTLAAWYAPDSAILSPDNRVIQWRDKTGQHGDSELRNDVQAPLLLNGSIHYTANRYSGLHHTIDIPSSQLALPQPFSIVVRARIDGNEAAPGATDYLFDGYNNSRTLITNNGSGANDEQFYFGVESGSMYPVNISRSTWQGQWHTYALVVNGLNSTSYLDGNLIATSDIGQSGLNGLRFGARFSNEHGLNGELPEAIICNEALDAAQILQIHAYLALKYS
ncbi:hypothetical protein D0T11_20395 [Hymenobacter rubripertinctus]|uniref:LamG domain-containing protein n=2 Tax=Hymenobacter rubripertinctus TaxID=2029981 RepID=A0A418QJY7_9BACT|nr:hypothetical protein D0T11_20395 [Hymenobacter rubripertinctus]